MSIAEVVELRNLESELARLVAKRDALAPAVEKTVEFVKRIEAEAAELGVSPVELALYLAPELASKGDKADKPAKTRKSHKPRELKIYINPHTKEAVETKGGNHKTLKQWKAEYGADVVESWRQVA